MEEELNGKEREAFMEDFTDIVIETINSIISIADKHNVDRDNAVMYFSQMFGKMAEVSTFQKWGEQQ